MAGADVRFSSPPATEVLQGVFFEAVPRFTSALQGSLWARSFQSEFPITEEKPPIEEVIERFGADILRKAGSFRFRVTDKPDAPRIWAKTKEGDRILQLQSNALITNWLKKKPPTDYIHYEQRKEDFLGRLNAVNGFFEVENLGSIHPTSCLMTYVNQVEVGDITEVTSIVTEIFNFAAERAENSWLPNADQCSFAVSYPMPRKRGRLHISANQAFREFEGEKQPLLRFELTARGQPEAKTIDSVLEWMDEGHKWIVNGFLDVTKESWQQKWGKQ